MNYLDNLKKNSWLIYLIFLIAVITFSSFVHTGFSTNDDYEYYVRYFNDSNIWKSSYEYAKMNGRFYFAFMQPLFNIILPYFFDSIVVTRVINLVLIALGVYMFTANIKLLFKDERIPYLFAIFFFTFVTIKGANNPIISYPFYFSTSWFLFQLAIYNFINFLNTGIARYKITAFVFYVFALLFYEVYFVFSISFFVIAFFMFYKQSLTKAFVYSFKAFSTILVVNLVYLTVYYVFKKQFSYELYDGVNITEDFNLFLFFQALGKLSKGAIPLHLYFSGHGVYNSSSYMIGGHVQSILSPLINIKTEWLIKSILIATSLILLRYFMSDLTKQYFDKWEKIMWFFLSVSMVFMPHLLLALTEKYQRYTNMGMDNYVTTYFTGFIYYTWLVFIYISILSIKLAWLKNVLFGLFITVIAYSAILIDYSNYHARRDLEKVYNLFNSIDYLLKCPDFQKINEGSTIVAPNLFELNSDVSYYNAGNFNISEYFKAKTGKTYFIQKNDSLIAPNDSNYFYLSYRNNNSGYYFLVSDIKANKTTLYISCTKTTQTLRYVINDSLHTENIELVPQMYVNTFKLVGMDHGRISVTDY
jgi:hypothetical protein